jgi:hypothetical protein
MKKKFGYLDIPEIPAHLLGYSADDDAGDSEECGASEVAETPESSRRQPQSHARLNSFGCASLQLQEASHSYPASQPKFGLM